MMKRTILGGVAGLFLGLLGSVVAVVASAVLAFAQDRHVRIPGVIHVWAVDSDGARGIGFDPSTTGFAVTIALAVALGAASALYLGRPQQRRHLRT